MDRVVELIENATPLTNPTAQDLTDFDILAWGRRNRFIALVLGTDAIVLDWKRLSSSRIRLSNLDTLPPVYVMKRSPDHPLTSPHTVENISHYFKENEDNPFGVWNVILSLGPMKPPSKALTQFPPLTYSKAHHSDALDAMRKQMRPGDNIFTFDRSSRISSLIRRWDHCMWSHAIICGQGGDVYEATTAGTVKSSFDRLYDD